MDVGHRRYELGIWSGEGFFEASRLMTMAAGGIFPQTPALSGIAILSRIPCHMKCYGRSSGPSVHLHKRDTVSAQSSVCWSEHRLLRSSFDNTAALDNMIRCLCQAGRELILVVGNPRGAHCHRSSCPPKYPPHNGEGHVRGTARPSTILLKTRMISRIIQI